jgi:hypothetical protein
MNAPASWRRPRFRLACLIPLATALAMGCALPAETRARIDEDLKYCEGLEGGPASALHKSFFAADRIDGAAYRRFFETRIREIEGEGVLFASCGGAMACTDRGGRMRVSRRYAELGMPRLLRVSLLIHEARHAEGWAHERCPSDGAALDAPFQKTDLRGAEACDATELGALGTQYVWLRDVASACSSCSSEERRQALDYSDFVLSLITSPQARERLRPEKQP